MQNRVYGNPAENPSAKNGQAEVPANVPEDAAFAALYASRRVSYLPQVAEALRHSEAPKRLLDRYTEAATLLASDLIYWTPKSTANGWIYKSRDEIERETGLPERRQRRARELLREAGVVEERAKGYRLYYRICWGGLKPLLRLAAESTPAEYSASHGDANYSASHGDAESLGRMATQRSGSHGDAASVMTTDVDEQTRQHQSIDARETDAGEDGAQPGEEAPAADGLMDGYQRGENSLGGNAGAVPPETTPSANGAAASSSSSGRGPSETITSERSEAGRKASGEGPEKEGEEPAPGSLSEPALGPPLWTRIRLEMESLSATDISDEARELAEALAASLGREQADAGLVRVAGYAALHDLPELLGEIEARRYGQVEHPTRYYAKGLAIEIKDEDVAPRQPRPGSLTSRFEAALGARGGSTPKSGTRRHTAAGECEGGGHEERVQLGPAERRPEYGVRDASAQPDLKDYFVRGGREGREQKERMQREREAEARGETGTST